MLNYWCSLYTKPLNIIILEKNDGWGIYTPLTITVRFKIVNNVCNQ